MEREEVISIKIVSVDYYSSFPIKQLDTTYSEFRKSEVKQVPVIRIFGITKDKKKICANIHGVFPYLYIPCAETNHDKINEFMNDVATAIDKNINISYGQSSAATKHVFKIALVKGVPYYGYHHAEHQFLRINLYNPNILRRVSNALQAGAIMGKILQPHESHIPYILKFFIDYNLFGMSYLYVPSQCVHTRQSNDKEIFRKKSVSELEVDFKAIHILNRLVVAEENSNKAANPGIESIWEDERLRRSVMDPETVPPLETNVSQARDCLVTESDIFFRTILSDKLKARSNESTMSQTMVESDSPVPKKKFNLKDFLDASTYAAEFTSQGSVSTKSSTNSEEKPANDSSSASEAIDNLECHFLNFTEDEDAEALLDDLDDNNVDLDSTLAPISQSVATVASNSNQLTQPGEIEDITVESDDEMFKELNVTVADLEIFSQYVKDQEDETIPQLDGVVDDLEPSKSSKTNSELQPGPSSLQAPIKLEQQSESCNISNSSDIQSSLKILAEQFKKSPNLVEEKTSPTFESDEDELIQSFYDQTMMLDDFESEDEEINETVIVETEKEQDELNLMKECVITQPVEQPAPSEASDRLSKFETLMCVHPTPFYSNPNDVTGKKEVGHNILRIPAKRLDEFKTKASNELKSAEDTKHEKVIQGDVICQYIDPPSYQDAHSWLKLNSDDKMSNPTEESPVKEKREKTLLVLELDEDMREDLDSTLVPSTPPTPSTPDFLPSSQEKDSSSLSDYIEDGLFLTYSARKKRKNMKKSFSKRFQEIMKSKAAAEMENSPASNQVSEDVLKLSQSSNNSTRSSLSEEIPKTSQSTAQSSDQNSSVIIRNANIQEDLSINDSDLTGPSLNNTYGFKMKLESLTTNEEHTDLTILAMEVHVQTRNDLKPNPEFDAISAIFYSLDGWFVDNEVKNLNGIIACVDDKSFRYAKSGVSVSLVKSEMDIFETFFQRIREFDPDIFAGYEIETASWGYFIQRGYVLNMNLNNALSRMPTEKLKVPVIDEEDQRDVGDYNSEQKIPGRIMLDVWRLMKHEIALTSYTFENICYHVLHRRYPKHTFSFLTTQWKDTLRKWIVLDYYYERARTLIEILKQLDLIGRTCELAKLFGIQFYEVLSRGSQFRVESMMIRIAKRRNYVPVSPSVQQRAHMRAPEYIPLILEPESRFYPDPVIVLDFQSLYPSIIIAYNYCFSTCLGRVEHLTKVSSQPFEFGAYQLRVSPTRLQQFLDRDLVTVSPCGVVYVKESVKEGVLPRMLREILDTRLMVKQSMKIHKSNSALQRVLHSRQLGLKLIANVTYGYTAANFSGRMPAIEVGDSVVSKGRETLERAIKLVEANNEWGCRVCYGDTDSMFVVVPGRSRQEAFAIGEKIAEAVTNDNPHPIKLKLEKVYQPCILQTKKRYVGYMYESADQKHPIYEAKGIETVRRDGCPAAAKMLEKTLRILFETCDVSKVKEYVCRQFTKILSGRSSIQDLTFAKEFRGINGYKDRACVPSLTLARKWMLHDPRSEPRRGERVPFVIVNGAPNLPLIRLVRSPLDVLEDENYKINSIYYITKAIIPPLNRCLLLIGANAFDWFAELPRRQQFVPLMSSASSSMSIRKGTISQFFTTTSCATCDNQTHQAICLDCKRNSQKTVLLLYEKITSLEQKSASIRSICESCCRRNFETSCVSLDCPVLYASVKANRDHKQVSFYREILDEF